VEEGLLLDGVDLQAGDVTARDAQRAALVEADPANAIVPREDHATVPAREALDLLVLEPRDQLGRALRGAALERAVERLDLGIPFPRHSCKITTMSDQPPIVGRFRKGELTIDQIAELQPGLARLMPEVSDAYWYAWYAAKGGNWRLAGYYVKKCRTLFGLCAIARPKHTANLEAYTAHTLEPLLAAANAKDLAAFERLYLAGIEEANRYHVVTGHPEIVWKLPPEAPTHLDLGPQPDPPPKQKP
jgi:hypothetical protein